MEKTFEKKLEILEKIVQEMEEGDLSLQDSLKKFEEGIGLYKDCKKIIGEAESKIRVLTDSLKEEDFLAE